MSKLREMKEEEIAACKRGVLLMLSQGVSISLAEEIEAIIYVYDEEIERRKAKGINY